MKRGTGLALLVCLSAACGCTSAARPVAWNPVDGTGTVAIPNNSDDWPTHYRSAALALIVKEAGPNYVITSEGEVVTGKSTVNNQQVTTDQVSNPRNPNQVGQQQTVSGSVTQKNLTEYRISFVRTQGPPSATGPNARPNTGVTQAGGPPAGTVPSVFPQNNVVPAGGPTTGTNPRPSQSVFGNQQP
jgi:hypothetical protein